MNFAPKLDEETLPTGSVFFLLLIYSFLGQFSVQWLLCSKTSAVNFCGVFMELRLGVTFGCHRLNSS